MFRAQVSGDIAVMVLQNVAVLQVVWGSGSGLEAWSAWFKSCFGGRKRLESVVV